MPRPQRLWTALSETRVFGLIGYQNNVKQSLVIVASCSSSSAVDRGARPACSGMGCGGAAPDFRISHNGFH